MDQVHLFQDKECIHVLDSKVLIESIVLFLSSAWDSVFIPDARESLLIKDCPIVAEKGVLLIRRDADVVNFTLVGQVGVISVVTALTCEHLLVLTDDAFGTVCHDIGQWELCSTRFLS